MQKQQWRVCLDRRIERFRSKLIDFIFCSQCILRTLDFGIKRDNLFSISFLKFLQNSIIVCNFHVMYILNSLIKLYVIMLAVLGLSYQYDLSRGFFCLIELFWIMFEYFFVCCQAHLCGVLFKYRLPCNTFTHTFMLKFLLFGCCYFFKYILFYI